MLTSNAVAAANLSFLQRHWNCFWIAMPSQLGRTLQQQQKSSVLHVTASQILFTALPTERKKMPYMNQTVQKHALLTAEKKKRQNVSVCSTRATAESCYRKYHLQYMDAHHPQHPPYFTRYPNSLITQIQEVLYHCLMEDGIPGWPDILTLSLTFYCLSFRRTFYQTL